MNHPNEKKLVLFVCSANKARSPVAEHIFRKVVVEADDWAAGNVEVASAGVITEELLQKARELGRVVPRKIFGVSPRKPVLRAMLARGIDLSGHRSRPLTRSLVDMAHLIIVMESSHRDRIVSLYDDSRGKVFTLNEFVEGADNSDVEDPGWLRSGRLGTWMVRWIESLELRFAQSREKFIGYLQDKGTEVIS